MKSTPKPKSKALDHFAVGKGNYPSGQGVQRETLPDSNERNKLACNFYTENLTRDMQSLVYTIYTCSHVTCKTKPDGVNTAAWDHFPRKSIKPLLRSERRAKTISSRVHKSRTVNTNLCVLALAKAR